MGNLVCQYKRVNRWNDGKRRIADLTTLDLKKIHNIKVFFFAIKFKDGMTDEQLRLVLNRLNNVTRATTGEDVLDFLQFLIDNEIKFTLGWRWNGKGLIANLRTYLYIRKLKKEYNL